MQQALQSPSWVQQILDDIRHMVHWLCESVAGSSPSWEDPQHRNLCTYWFWENDADRTDTVLHGPTGRDARGQLFSQVMGDCVSGLDNRVDWLYLCWFWYVHRRMFCRIRVSWKLDLLLFVTSIKIHFVTYIRSKLYINYGWMNHRKIASYGSCFRGDLLTTLLCKYFSFIIILYDLFWQCFLCSIALCQSLFLWWDDTEW